MAIVQPNVVVITAAADTAINNALTALQTQVDALPLADLDADTTATLQTIDDVREPYVLRAIEQHAANFPKIVPPFLSHADALNNLISRKKLKTALERINKIKEQLEELTMRTEHNLYHFTRKVYDLAKEAEDSGTVPGIGTVVKDLAPLFEGQGVKGKGGDAADPVAE